MLRLWVKSPNFNVGIGSEFPFNASTYKGVIPEKLKYPEFLSFSGTTPLSINLANEVATL